MWHWFQTTPTAISYSIHFWLRCALASAGLLGIIFFAANVAKKRNSGALQNAKLKSIEAGSTIMGRAGIFLLGAIVGFGGRDLMQFYRTKTLTGVHVISRNGPQYEVRISYSDYHLVFCGKVPNLKPGYILDKLVVEDRGDCLSVDPRGTQYAIAQK